VPLGSPASSGLWRLSGPQNEIDRRWSLVVSDCCLLATFRGDQNGDSKSLNIGKCRTFKVASSQPSISAVAATR
jgi:hypothetical protein